MELILMLAGVLILAAFADAAADFGEDSRALFDETRHITYGVGLS